MAALACWYVRRRLKGASIVILCYYQASKTDILARYNDISVSAVNEFWGRGAKITIIVTTRTEARTNSDGRQHQFLFDERRTTVALFRAQEELSIVGDWPLSVRFASQQRFLTYCSFIRVGNQEFQKAVREVM